MLYHNQPDKEGHKYGAVNKHVRKKIKQSDEYVGYLIDQIKQFNLEDSINVIILSDHGMIDVKKDGLIFLDDYININDDDIIIHTYGLISQIDVLNPTKMNQILSTNIDNAQMFSRNNIPERFHYVNNNTTDIILAANPGYYITNHKKQEKRPFDAKGMHGYDPELKDMHAIFYAFGPSFLKGKYINSFENIHIYPLICKLLAIKPNEEGDELPQGRLDKVQAILKLNSE